MGFHKLIVPTINVNDDTVLFGNHEKQNMEHVSKGEILCCFETSKATEDFVSTFDGYILWLVEDYEEIKVGAEFCVIFDTKEEAEKGLEHNAENKQTLPEGFKASKKAIEYAKSINFDITLIHKNGIVKTEDIEQYIADHDTNAVNIQAINKDVKFVYDSTPKRIAILGAGRGGMQVLDLVAHMDGYLAVALFDDDSKVVGTKVYGVPVVGKIDFDLIAKCYSEDLFDYIVNGIGTSCEIRKHCFDELTGRGVPYCNLIHESVQIGEYVKMGTGNIIMPMTQIGPNAEIGNDCFITAKTGIEHHNIIGSHCTFGPGVMMSGSVTIGNCTKFGAGVFIEPSVNIGSNCKIASGSIITKHIPSDSILRNKIEYDVIPINPDKPISGGGCPRTITEDVTLPTA